MSAEYEDGSSGSGSTVTTQQKPGHTRKPTKQFVAHSKRNASTTRLNKLKGPEEFRRIKSTDNVVLRRNKSKNKISQLHSLHKADVSSPGREEEGNKESVVPNRQRSGGILQLEHEDSDDEECEEDQQRPVDKKEADREKQVNPSVAMGEGTISPPDEGSPVPTKETKDSSDSSAADWKPSFVLNSPAPKPQLTTETVVAVSDMSPSQEYFPTTPRQRQHDAEPATFLDKTASAADLRSTTTRTQQKLWLQRDLNPPQHPSSSMLLTTEQRKEFERISKEYMSIRKFFSPVVRSLERLQHRQAHGHSMIPKSRKSTKFKSASSAGSPVDSSGLSQSFPKRVNSLSATTLKSPSTPSNTWHTASPTYTSNIAYLLNRMWTDDGSDSNQHETENSSNQNGSNKSTSSPTFAGNAPPINSQAQLVNARIRQAVG
ncbi:hypothetical protein TRICI_004339 [Trichomonascus ciferrii]|uniref:Uncharacterized protein n=1 Tax=Trichomonascus ciferrii TaxID=44093 RepID=A0A642V178_9ASCO|nr:hypothetical protein TRICI_004339 [Trichomonascus ciferrii]